MSAFWISWMSYFRVVRHAGGAGRPLGAGQGGGVGYALEAPLLLGQEADVDAHGQKQQEGHQPRRRYGQHLALLLSMPKPQGFHSLILLAGEDKGIVDHPTPVLPGA